MNQAIAVACLCRGDVGTYRNMTHRTARFLARLPYCEELRSAYTNVASVCWNLDKNAAAARRWLEMLRPQAE